MRRGFGELLPLVGALDGALEGTKGMREEASPCAFVFVLLLEVGGVGEEEDESGLSCLSV